MGEGTKKQALEKLSMFNTKIGYPDEWKDYSKLTIRPNALVENMMASSRFEHRRELDKLSLRKTRHASQPIMNGKIYAI